MTRLGCTVMGCALTLAIGAGPALAQDGDAVLDDDPRNPRFDLPDMSPDLLDRRGTTRFHFTSRFSGSNADEVVSDDLVMSFILAGAVSVTPGLAITGALPFAGIVPNPGGNTFVFGNIRLGLAGGHSVRFYAPQGGERAPRIGFGGALDLYLPTGSFSNPDDGSGILNPDPVGTPRALTPFEPELFIDNAFVARGRGHLDFEISIVSLAVEGGLSTGVSTDSNADVFVLGAFATRIAVRPIVQLEPYVELSKAFHVGGTAPLPDNVDPPFVDLLGLGEIETPLTLTVGARGHFSGFDPALFVSINLDDTGLIFGLDLAASIRPGPSRSRSRDDGFLDDDF